MQMEVESRLDQGVESFLWEDLKCKYFLKLDSSGSERITAPKIVTNSILTLMKDHKLR